MSRVPALQAVAFGLALVAAPMALNAQGLVHTQKLSAPLANELVGEAVASCAQKGYAVTAIVVDLDGVRQALLRGNGAPIHTLDNAFYKAHNPLIRRWTSTPTAGESMLSGAAQPRSKQLDLQTSLSASQWLSRRL